MTKPAMPAKHQRGAMMLEALIGILIFSTGILALIGMQAMAIAYSSDAKYRADASFFANQIISEIWVNRGALANYEYDGTGAPPAELTNWVSSIEGALPGASAYKPIVGVDTATGQVTVTVRWRPPNSETERNHRTIALITNP
jgi:type IV pilus assembly protein PilV